MNRNIYEIIGVMGPDEYHASTDNNVYTNVVAGLSIYLAEFAQCVGGCPQLPPSWTQVTKRLQTPLFQVAASLALEYSKELDFHPQYRGYTPGTVIKQADTVLVSWLKHNAFSLFWLAFPSCTLWTDLPGTTI